MSTTHVIEIIQKQIDAVSPILERLAYLKAMPSGMKAGGNQALAEVCYSSASISEFEEKVDRWQYATKSVLVACFGADHEHTQSFNSTIVHDRIYRDAKEELEHEIKEGRNTLYSIIEAVSLKSAVSIHSEVAELPADQTSNHPKVFISHSSEDKALIQSFVENVLVLGLGLTFEDIAFTSHDVYGVEPGDNIISYIKDNITSAKAVLVMVSQHYKKSEVCLNEMGAAWAHGQHCLSVILPDADFSTLGWLSSFEKAEKINDKEQLVRLCGKIADLLGINLTKRFAAAALYIDKFIGGVVGESSANNSSTSPVLVEGDVDKKVMSVINRLGEFSLKELLDATGIRPSYLREKLSALVSAGVLESYGPYSNKRYRIRDKQQHNHHVFH